MSPIISTYLQDNESLLYYERNWGKSYRPNLSDTIMNIIASERGNNKYLPDTYYDGLGDIWLKQQYCSISKLMWKLPYDLSKDYLITIGENIYVKGERFNDWADLITRIPSSLLLAAALSDQFSLSFLRSMSDMSCFIKKWMTPYTYTTIIPPYLPEFSYWVNHSHGINDLHIHLNGSTETDRIWFDMITYKNDVVRDFTKSYSSKLRIRKLSAQIYPGFNPNALKCMLEHAETLRKRICQYIGRIEYDKDDLDCTTVNELYGDICGNIRCGVLIEEIHCCPV